VQKALRLLPVIGVSGSSGSGKTTLLRKLQQQIGGAWISMKELLHSMRQSHPLAIEETLERLVENALEGAEHVFLDDLSTLSAVVSGCGPYPRPNLLAGVFESVTVRVAAASKKLPQGH
jgi:ABC-type phosphate/phosphonate transport system ATPase subunit